MTYRVDWARFSDLGQIARLEELSFPEPLSHASLIKLWLDRDTRYLVIRRDHRVAAYIGFQLMGPIAHTISMGVHPDHRRRGLAIRIQEAANQVASSLGARWFMGEVRKSNTPQLNLLLSRLGWQAIGICKRFFSDGEDAVVVWHLLDSASAKPFHGDPGAVIHTEGAQE